MKDLVKGRKIIKKYISEMKFTYSELLTLDLKVKFITISSSISLDLTCLIKIFLKDRYVIWKNIGGIYESCKRDDDTSYFYKTTRINRCI